MGEWHTVSLADLCDDVQYGVTASASTDLPNGPLLLRITDIVPPRIDWGTVPACDVPEDKIGKFELRDGDIVVARTGATVGYAKYVKRPPARAVFASYLVRFRVGDRVDPEYIGHVVQSAAYKDYVAAHAGGAAQPNANAKVLGSFPVPVPEKRTQRRIAAVLSAFDELIEINERRIELLEDLARSLYREWFVHFRFPGHEDVELVGSALGPIPEGWEILSLGEICERITDGAHKSPPTTTTGLPMASVKDMTERRLDITTCRPISAEDFEELERQHCRPMIGDVLVAKDGSYLKHVFAVEEDQAVVILSSIALLRTNARMRPSVLALHLQQGEIRERLTGYVSGAAIPRIVLKDFRGFPILVPPVDVQETFEELANPMRHTALALDKAAAQLRVTRDLLLPRLVTGRLDIADIELGILTPTGAD